VKGGIGDGDTKIITGALSVLGDELQGAG